MYTHVRTCSYLHTQHVLVHMCCVKERKYVGTRMAYDEVSYLEQVLVLRALHAPRHEVAGEGHTHKGIQA